MAPTGFPAVLYRILTECSPDIIAWTKSGRAFGMSNMHLFKTVVLPQYFNHDKFSSFQRQLNLYGFRKIIKGRENGCYYHPGCQRGHEDFLRQVKRGVAAVVDLDYEFKLYGAASNSARPGSQIETSPDSDSEQTELSARVAARNREQTTPTLTPVQAFPHADTDSDSDVESASMQLRRSSSFNRVNKLFGPSSKPSRNPSSEGFSNVSSSNDMDCTFTTDRWLTFSDEQYMTEQSFPLLPKSVTVLPQGSEGAPFAPRRQSLYRTDFCSMLASLERSSFADGGKAMLPNSSSNDDLFVLEGPEFSGNLIDVAYEMRGCEVLDDYLGALPTAPQSMVRGRMNRHLSQSPDGGSTHHMSQSDGGSVRTSGAASCSAEGRTLRRRSSLSKLIKSAYVDDTAALARNALKRNHAELSDASNAPRTQLRRSIMSAIDGIAQIDQLQQQQSGKRLKAVPALSTDARVEEHRMSVDSAPPATGQEGLFQGGYFCESTDGCSSTLSNWMEAYYSEDAIKDLNRSLEVQQHSDDEPEHTDALVDSDNTTQPNAAKLRGSVYVLLNLLRLAQDETDNSGTVESGPL